MTRRRTGPPRRAAIGVARWTTVLAATLAMVTACTSSGSDSAWPPGSPFSPADAPPGAGDQPPRDLPPVASESQAVAPVLDRIRAIDPCALHSLDAAQQATGLTGDLLMPDSDLDECELRMGQTDTDSSASWSLRTALGVAREPTGGQSASEQLGEVTASKTTQSGADPQRECSYAVSVPTDQPATPGQDTPSARPAGPMTITITAARGITPHPKPPCQVAQEYVRGAGKFWKTPALRTDRLTDPALPIAEAHPCTGLGSLQAALGGPVEAVLSEAHSCGIRRAAPAASGAPGAKPKKTSTVATVRYQLDADPRVLLRVDQSYEPVTIAGRPGVRTKASGNQPPGKGANDCKAEIIVDEKAFLQPNKSNADKRKNFPIISARAETCELATAAIEAARPGQPGPSSAPTPGAEQRLAGRAAGSVKIGDLNPPPSARDVGAPFDPCALAEAFPADVRGTNHPGPDLLKPETDQKFDVICSYDYTPAREVSLKPGQPAPPAQGGRMLADVIWQDEPGGDPAGKTNADGSPVEAIGPGSPVWGGKTGYVRDAGVDDKLGPVCVAAVQLGKGTGAVYVWNSAFPQHKPCDIARSVAAAIAAASK